MTDMLGVGAQREAGTDVVRVVGAFDLASAAAWNATIDALLANDPSRICIDVGDVTFVDSYGLRLWAMLRRHAADRGITVTLRRVGPSVRRLLELACLTDYLVADDSDDVAV
ncbi:MAG: STAS domain-containing protein [Ilumatobacteraceae bacterium]